MNTPDTTRRDRLDRLALDAHRKGWTWGEFSDRTADIMRCPEPRLASDVTAELLRLLSIVTTGKPGRFDGERGLA
jgi:hypothetical protein